MSASAPTSPARRSSEADQGRPLRRSRRRGAPAGREAARRCIDVNMDEGLLDSEQAMVALPQPDRRRARHRRVPVMVDSSKWSVIEAGLKCLQGKGIVNSISLKEGEAAFLRQARWCALRRGGGGDGLRRTGPGRHRRAQGRDLRARLPLLTEQSASRRRTSSSIPTSSPSPPASRSTTTTRSTSSRPRANSSGASRLPRLRRRLERLVLVPRQRAGAPGDPRRCSCTTRSGRHGHGHRQRRRAAALRRPRCRAARAGRGRGAQPPRDGTERLLEIAETLKGRKGEKKVEDLAWRDQAGARAPEPRAGARHRREYIDADTEEARLHPRVRWT
jgi:hypothetical protein